MVVQADPLELLAARKLSAAESAMLDAMEALNAVGSAEAVLHATELMGAYKIMRRWELALRRIAAEGDETEGKRA